jgi:hypothetical protein
MAKHLMNAGSSGRGWSYRERQLSCTQYHALEHHPELKEHPDVVRAKMADRQPLIKGSLVHVGAAHHYTHVQGLQGGWDTSQWHLAADAIHLAAEAEEERLAGTSWEGSWRRHTKLAQDAIAAYAQHYYNEHLTILAVEHRVELPVEGESFLGTQVATTHSARIDLIVQSADGRVWFWDHKTTYKVDARKKRGFGLAGQIIGHHMLGRHLYGDNFGGVRMNMIGMRPGAMRFQRFAPEPAPFALGELRQQIIDRQALINALMASGRDPWRWPKALGEQGPCEDRYGPCPFRDLCRWGPRN